LNLDVQVEIKGASQRLPPQLETVVFRVAQEAITNVARHAGVGQARLELLFEEQQVILKLIDHGVGMAMSTPGETTLPGWGITGMRERAEAVGGELHIYSSPGQGVQVELCLPFSPAQLNPTKSGDSPPADNVKASQEI
jgi:signal transduction histidine kinase